MGLHPAPSFSCAPPPWRDGALATVADPLSAFALNGLAALAALALLAVSPAGDGRVAVLTFGDTSAFDVVVGAGGAVLALAPSAHLAVGQSAAPDFRARLRAAGAALVFNPLLAGGCEPLRSSEP